MLGSNCVPGDRAVSFGEKNSLQRITSLSLSCSPLFTFCEFRDPAFECKYVCSSSRVKSFPSSSYNNMK